MLVTKKDREEDKIEQEKLSPFNKYTTLHDIDRYIYDANSIDDFRMDEAIQNHPLMHNSYESLD